MIWKFIGKHETMRQKTDNPSSKQRYFVLFVELVYPTKKIPKILISFFKNIRCFHFVHGFTVAPSLPCQPSLTPLKSILTVAAFGHFMDRMARSLTKTSSKAMALYQPFCLYI